jgi:3-hydroxyisobutyrate dehydrogenase-like beta-hydroxyacid dehydrogenase
MPGARRLPSRPEPLQALEGQVDIAASSREVGDRADIVLACLPSLEAYRDAVMSGAGLQGSTRLHTYVHLGTTGMAMVEDIMAVLTPRIAVLDAPITGGVTKAVDGTLTSIVSGDPKTVAATRGVLDAYSARVITVSDTPGSAQVMKLVNNIMSLTNLASGCEALLVGAKAGLDPRVMLDVLNNGSGQNSATLAKIPLHVLPRGFDFGASLSIALKDAEQFLAEAKAAGVPVEICQATSDTYHRAAAQLGVNADMSNVARSIERAAGFELPASAKKLRRPNH